MRKLQRREMVALLGAVLVVGVVAVWLFWPRPEVVIEVDGSPGMKLAGDIRADQAAGKIEAPIPTNIHAHARSVSFTLENVGEPGTMTLRARIDGKEVASLTADKDHPVVRGTVTGGRVSWQAEPKQGP
jgi:hypothetical protein